VDRIQLRFVLELITLAVLLPSGECPCVDRTQLRFVLELVTSAVLLPSGECPYMDRTQLRFVLLILLDDLIEDAAGVLSLDLLFDPLVGGKVRDITLVGKACPASEDSDDATIPSEDDRPRVASMRKLAAPLIVG
jgi:hypothetical protein